MWKSCERHVKSVWKHGTMWNSERFTCMWSFWEFHMHVNFLTSMWNFGNACENFFHACELVFMCVKFMYCMWILFNMHKTIFSCMWTFFHACEIHVVHVNFISHTWNSFVMHVNFLTCMWNLDKGCETIFYMRVDFFPWKQFFCACNSTF